MAKKDVPADASEALLTDISDSLSQIRRLMIYSLIRNGASQDDVASALGVSQPTLSRLLVKKASKKGS